MNENINKKALVITSIASDQHPVLKQYAQESSGRGFDFILIGDESSPKSFQLDGCDFYSLEGQGKLDFRLAKILPTRHYARKNIGYLLAMSKGAELIRETDDDNIPMKDFWLDNKLNGDFLTINEKGWNNVYQHFSQEKVWPRGFSLSRLDFDKKAEEIKSHGAFPIQQGLADDNPDVDAIFRLTNKGSIIFGKREPLGLGLGVICPFNSQNTTWFKEAFMLMYLPSYCSFRMTDIWRSFVAQRIAWTCGWGMLFHESTVRQERNEHDLLKDFSDEVVGYLNNQKIMEALNALDLKDGPQNIADNLISCYSRLIDLGLIKAEELDLLKAWIDDVRLVAPGLYEGK